ncbi:MAG: hypothetical protein U7126_03755 [Microcoleus sp.]
MIGDVFFSVEADPLDLRYRAEPGKEMNRQDAYSTKSEFYCGTGKMFVRGKPDKMGLIF